MVILGLTGSIGMGKSTAAGMLRALGVPVCDSDAVVHAALAKGGAAVPRVAAAFDGVVVDGAVDRQKLGAAVFGNTPALRRLEAILHPMVRDAQTAFLRRESARRTPVVVLDVPLLFESGTDARCDATIVVTAPRFLQEQRVLARPGMTRERFDSVLARQLPDATKRRLADFVVQSGLGRRHALRRLEAIVRLVRRWPGRKWPPRNLPVRSRRGML
jgi:dephospho-CoA kinase